MDSPAAVAQVVLTNLKLFLESSFLDTSAGVPWLQNVIGTGSQSDTVIPSQILNSTGVTGINSYGSSLNHATRELSINASVQTQFSAIPHHHFHHSSPPPWSVNEQPDSSPCDTRCAGIGDRHQRPHHRRHHRFRNCDLPRHLRLRRGAESWNSRFPTHCGPVRGDQRHQQPGDCGLQLVPSGLCARGWGYRPLCR